METTEFENFEKKVEAAQKRSKEIENLAISFVEQMTKLGLTVREYQRLKTKLDILVDSSKVTL